MRIRMAQQVSFSDPEYLGDTSAASNYTDNLFDTSEEYNRGRPTRGGAAASNSHHYVPSTIVQNEGGAYPPKNGGRGGTTKRGYALRSKRM